MNFQQLCLLLGTLYKYMQQQQVQAHQNDNSHEVSQLEPESRSSITDNPTTPHIYNIGDALSYSPQSYSPKITNQQLYDLISSNEKVYDPASKQYLSSFLLTVITCNNQAYELICKMEKRELGNRRDDAQANQNKFAKLESNQQIETIRQILAHENTISHSLNKAIESQALSEQKIEQEIGMLLNKAEQILQYAASCGRNINRRLIICVLSNQACFYQKLWELFKSCSYTEAIILNMEQWGQQSNWSELSEQCSSSGSQVRSRPSFVHHSNVNLSQKATAFSKHFHRQIDTEKIQLAKNYELVNIRCNNNLSFYACEEPEKVTSFQHNSFNFLNRDVMYHIIKMFELSIYYLQYSSLCGQLANHAKAIEVVKKVIKKTNKINKMNRKLYQDAYPQSNQYVIPFKVDNEEPAIVRLTNKKIIYGLCAVGSSLADFGEKHIENYRETVRFYLRKHYQVFQKRATRRSHKMNELQMLSRKIAAITDQHWRSTYKSSDKNQLQDQINELEIEQLRKELKNFSISDILQIKCRLYKVGLNDQLSHASRQDFDQPRSASTMQQNFSNFRQANFQTDEDPEKQQEPLEYENLLMNLANQTSTFGYQFLFSSALLLSTSYFILATELRHQATKQQRRQGERFKTKQYKESEFNHLIAIILLIVYVPADMTYLKHMVSSYENYYAQKIRPTEEIDITDHEPALENKQEKKSEGEQVAFVELDEYRIWPKIREQNIETMTDLESGKNQCGFHPYLNSKREREEQQNAVSDNKSSVVAFTAKKANVKAKAKRETPKKKSCSNSPISDFKKCTSFLFHDQASDSNKYNTDDEKNSLNPSKGKFVRHRKVKKKIVKHSHKSETFLQCPRNSKEQNKPTSCTALPHCSISKINQNKAKDNQGEEKQQKNQDDNYLFQSYPVRQNGEKKQNRAALPLSRKQRQKSQIFFNQQLHNISRSTNFFTRESKSISQNPVLFNNNSKRSSFVSSSKNIENWHNEQQMADAMENQKVKKKKKSSLTKKNNNRSTKNISHSKNSKHNKGRKQKPSQSKQKIRKSKSKQKVKAKAKHIPQKEYNSPNIGNNNQNNTSPHKSHKYRADEYQYLQNCNSKEAKLNHVRITDLWENFPEKALRSTNPASTVMYGSPPQKNPSTLKKSDGSLDIVSSLDKKMEDEPKIIVSMEKMEYDEGQGGRELFYVAKRQIGNLETSKKNLKVKSSRKGAKQKLAFTKRIVIAQNNEKSNSKNKNQI